MLRYIGVGRCNEFHNTFFFLTATLLKHAVLVVSCFAFFFSFAFVLDSDHHLVGLVNQISRWGEHGTGPAKNRLQIRIVKLIYKNLHNRIIKTILRQSASNIWWEFVHFRVKQSHLQFGSEFFRDKCLKDSTGITFFTRGIFKYMFNYCSLPWICLPA